MTTSEIIQQEKSLASAFYKFKVLDSFEILGWHTIGEKIIFRSYLDQYWHWKISTGKKLLPISLIHNQDGLFSWLLEEGHQKPKKYKIIGEQAEIKREIIDPYQFPQQLSSETRYLWNKGNLWNSWKDLGCNEAKIEGIEGFIFRVWAPNAKRVALIGDLNNWNPYCHGMRFIKDCGIWEIFIPGLKSDKYSCYKFHIVTTDNKILFKADPYATQMQHPPETASIIHKNNKIDWSDKNWIKTRKNTQSKESPISIYEVHLPSWKKKEKDRIISYQELETELVPYIKEMGFTHVEFMPITEYPLDASWGYQPIGLYSPTIRLGTDKELKYLINAFHNAGIGVILDWVTAHFPTDAHGLSRFDGSFLYEYQDLRKGFHPDWKTLIFNYSRLEVINYLISNANYWIEEYHIDGLRMDAVSSMLFLSYSRTEGQWEPNELGGAENLEAIKFIKQLNKQIHLSFEGIITLAEEATMWQGVTKAEEEGGLGFDYKWNMGWMHDSLVYIKKEPEERNKFHHVLTHCIDYAFTENYLLPLSHDEVVHGKSPMIGKIPGYDEQKFPLLRVYYTYMWAHPGKKLLFMGNELAQRKEWNFSEELQWELLKHDSHKNIQELIKKLNYIYREQPALHKSDSFSNGFNWIKKNDTNESIFAFIRMANNSKSIIAIFNFSPYIYKDQKVGVPYPGEYSEILNTAIDYKKKFTSQKKYNASNESWDNLNHSIKFNLPAYTAILLNSP